MKTDDIRKMGLAYLQVQEANKKVNKHGHDAVDHEDDDIDNDGDKDESDDYLHNRRKAIKANMKNEALVGNQHKIDANKNGKVDAHDFKLLRKGKKVAEEVEELDEISRDLARRYIRKVADKTNTGELSTKEVEKRRPGVNLAGKKAYPGIAGEPKVRATESVEHIDEVSSKKLGDYSAAAAQPKNQGAKKDKRIAGQWMADQKVRKKYGYSSDAKVAAESTEWPVFNRIMEKTDKFTVSYNVSGVGDDPHQIDMKFADPNHIKGATKPEAMDDNWSEGEKEFAKLHGMLGKFNDSGIQGHKAAGNTARAAAANVEVAPARPGDSKIGEKSMPKPKG